MRETDQAILNDMMLFIDGYYKPEFEYEETLELYTDIVLLLKTHIPQGHYTPYEVVRFVRNLILRQYPQLEYDSVIENIVFDRGDSDTKLHLALSELLACWESVLLRDRKLPLKKADVKINQTLYDILNIALPA